jgi:16S rRNA (cytidine1402-2'-O)-methyltransferase
MRGLLYIVSTPIGNLEDITLRALRILKEVDVIAAEDTRHTRKLLNHYSISKEMVSYWGAKEKVKAEYVMKRLSEGASVALVTDAGTPGISDPGEIVIRRAIEKGIDVLSIPGPSAIIAALSVSGLNSKEFVFVGFLPVKKNARLKRLAGLKFERRTMVVYEAPHRLLETLDDILSVFGERDCAVCHELTKLNEEVYRGSPLQIIRVLEEGKVAGEYVIILDGYKSVDRGMEEALNEVFRLMKNGMGRKEAVRQVALDYGLSQKMLYDESLHKGRAE